jgi:hypothetical protein
MTIPTFRGQDLEASRTFIRAVAKAFACKLEELSVRRAGEGSPDPRLATVASGEPTRARE